ncbi:hypothetical protein cyc_02608 [Cyclospora cayetanensis]|uniref:Uncharacterized protein n=1 Tax=Cyclospora cayetanensis TaxID=88456 RepID=A0A1D3D273_9EIME|nr:hypothetical protein cyc_02608 [Cyclospora cayetanensis]
MRLLLVQAIGTAVCLAWWKEIQFLGLAAEVIKTPTTEILVGVHQRDELAGHHDKQEKEHQWARLQKPPHSEAAAEVKATGSFLEGKKKKKDKKEKDKKKKEKKKNKKKRQRRKKKSKKSEGAQNDEVFEEGLQDNKEADWSGGYQKFKAEYKEAKEAFLKARTLHEFYDLKYRILSKALTDALQGNP